MSEIQNDKLIQSLVFKQLFEQDYSNQVCFDCFQALPEFASMNNGIFLCSNCAGLHRTFGAVISNVKSLT